MKGSPKNNFRLLNKDDPIVQVASNKFHGAFVYQHLT